MSGWPDSGEAGVGTAVPGQSGPPGGSETDDASSTYRGRFSAAARARGVPLATIVTTLVLGFALLDLNALVILLLWVLRTVILYTVVGGFIALLLSPAVRLLQRTGMPRGFAVVVVFVAALVAFVVVVVSFTAPLVSGVTHFARELPKLVTRAEHGHGQLGRLLVRLHLLKWVKTNAPKLAGDITRSLKPAQALSVGKAAFTTFVALGQIAVLSLFILLEAPMLRRAVLSQFRPERRDRIQRVYLEASRSVTGYMLGNMLTSVIAGVVVLVTLLSLGVPYPFLLGAWVALVDLLPLVGGLLAGIPVVIIAALHSVPALIVTLIVFLVYQQIENHILNPVIMSRTVRLNPLWVLMAVLIGATLGSRVGSGLGTFVGALIGIPLGGATQVVAREIRKGPSDVPLGASDGPTDGPGGFPLNSGRMRVLVIVPTYNEAENIQGVLQAVHKTLPDAGILVVDDGSPDGTADLVDEVAGDLGDVHVMRRSAKSGLGSAYRAGFAWGLEHGYEACVEMDADFSHDPAALTDLVAPLTEGYEVCIGSRYVPGGSIPNWSWSRHLLSWGGNRYASALLGLGVHDSTAGFRAYAATVLRRLDLDRIRAEGYGFQIEMTYRSKQAGAAICEVPIRFVDRVAGESKMSSSIVVEALGLVTWWGLGRAWRALQRLAGPLARGRAGQPAAPPPP